jgi:F-type H+-transporting ATPase subunit gamma
MSETLSILRRKIRNAHDLHAVVRTMKAMAAASIGPYERAVAALVDYAHTVELGLVTCLRHMPAAAAPPQVAAQKIGAIVFGTDQGMVGQFNEHVAERVTATLASHGETTVWVVGERMESRLRDAGFKIAGIFQTPNSVAGITPLISELLIAIERCSERAGLDDVHLFHNRPRRRATYDSVNERILPLDAQWRRTIEATPWPTRALPSVIAGGPATLDALIREFLFVSLFRACAESLAAENARRFAAMQGAEKNIDELMGSLSLNYNRQRQAAIDEELFDLIAGYEVLRGEVAATRTTAQHHQA